MSHAHHHHSHSHGHGKNQAAPLLWKAIGITLFFMFVEFAGGYISNSLALISDAAHMLTDVGALLLSQFAIWVSQRPKNRKMSFGYHRAEILGALVSGLLIWVLAGFLIYEAIERMHDPQEVQGPIVFIVAFVGLLANLASMKLLHPEQGSNMNVRAAYVHMVSDLLGSIGVILAGLILWFTGWKPIDPLITLLFSSLMLYSSWSLVKESIEVLMESTPKHLNPLDIEKALLDIPGILEVHDLHIWSLSSGKEALSVHLISESPEKSLKKAHQVLGKKFHIHHSTIQVEHPKHFKSEECYHCE